MINKPGLAKAILYRIYSSFITFLISWFITGRLDLAVSIGFLDMGIKIFSYYFFDKIWYSITRYKVKPGVIWLTGLSASGKTTIANDLVNKLKKKSIVSILLDGDEIRHALKQQSFDEDSRKKHNLNVGYISSLFEKKGNVVIVSLISPYEDIRNEVRKMCNNFIEVYISTDLQTCIKRDPKGLYKKAMNGDIKDFTGITAPYHPPLSPEITIDTSNLSVSECSTIILEYLKK